MYNAKFIVVEEDGGKFKNQNSIQLPERPYEGDQLYVNYGSNEKVLCQVFDVKDIISLTKGHHHITVKASPIEDPEEG